MPEQQEYYLFHSGEVVRDTGLLYFYHLLRNYPNNGLTKIKLEQNYLSFAFESVSIFQNACFTIIQEALFQGFINDLAVEKIESELYEDIKKQRNLNDVLEILKGKVTDNQLASIEKKGSSLYIPYLRNSGKFGANARSVANFQQNLRELIKLFTEVLRNEQQANELYGVGEVCEICHSETAPIYDLTHKYAIEKVESLPAGKRVWRQDSKYLYTFRGSEHNTFANYANYGRNSAICFTCEWLNLFFLLYVKLEKPSYLLLTENLVYMDFLQRKIHLKQNLYNNYQALLMQVAKSTKSTKVRVYRITTDAKRGILLKFANNIHYSVILQQVYLMSVIDRHVFPEGQKDITKVKNNMKDAILKENYRAPYQLLLGNVVARQNDRDYTRNNLNNLCKYIHIWKGAKGMVMDRINGEKEFYTFGKQLQTTDNREKIAFKLCQLLKSDDRKGIYETLEHLYDVNCKQKSSEAFDDQEEVTYLHRPVNFTHLLIKSNDLDCVLLVGSFIDGLFSTNNKEGGEKK